MKKLSVLAIVAMMAMASCSKDRVCSCTETISGAGTSTTDKKTLVGVSNGQAKAQCVSTKEDEEVLGTIITTTRDCKLD